MRELHDVFERLEGSAFRRGFSLGIKEREYLRNKGMETVLSHAADFISKRLGPAEPVNDGRQTPFKGHPVFVAQHATATCCRSCLEKWHQIPMGRELTDAEQRHVVDAIGLWLARQ